MSADMGLIRDICEAGLAKPRHRAPCNRCGLCCLMQQCEISVEIFGPQPRCPVLERAGNAYACGLITDPARHLGVPPESAPHFAMLFGSMLAIGTDCDSVAPWEKPAE